MGHTQLGENMPEPPVGTAAAHTVAVHALTVRGAGVAWGEGGRVLVTRRTDSLNAKGLWRGAGEPAFKGE